MLGVLVEIVAQEQPVDDDQLGQFSLSPWREERWEPGQGPGPLVLLTELVDAIQVLDRGVALGVEREVDDELPSRPRDRSDSSGSRTGRW